MSISDLEGCIMKSIKEATTEVFSAMLMINGIAEDSFIKNEKDISTDMISSLHFFGEKYMGKVAVFSSGTTACHISGTMLGMEMSEVDEDVKDGMGEIVNMIAGSAKVKLESTMGDFHLLTPWIIAGRNLTNDSPSESEVGMSIDSQAQFSWIMTKFTYDKGSFIVGVQANQVPQSNTSDTNDISILQSEIEELKSENASLKSVIEEAGMAV
jgi:chemotaxis protein CheX